MPRRKRTFAECMAARRLREQRPQRKRLVALEAKLARLRVPVADEDAIIADLITEAQRVPELQPQRNDSRVPRGQVGVVGGLAVRDAADSLGDC